MGEAHRPVIYAGGGILKARAAEALRELAELTGFPVVTTLMARGAFPDDHAAVPRHAGHARQLHRDHRDAEVRPAHRARARASTTASPASSTASRPTPRSSTSTSTPPSWARSAGPTCRSWATAALVIEEMVKAVRAEKQQAATWPDARRRGTRSCASGRSSYPLHYEQLEDGPLKPQFCIDMLRDNTPDDTIVASGVGQHQMWTSQRWKFNHPYTWINSGGLGTMGFAVPAAIGAKVGKPERMVWAVDGDGCFQMTAQELVTASAERIPVKIAILNNAYLGMVRQWQELFYEERYSEVYLSPDLPDYVKWAEAMGCVGFRVDTPEDVEPDDREGERDRRPSGGHRLPHRLPGEGVPDGRARHVERRRDPRPRPRPDPRDAVRRLDDDERASIGVQHHILSVLVENKFGVLSRVAGLFARRGFNIVSLAVSPTEDERFSRMTIVVDADVGAARAGHQAAQQADPRDQDRRARRRPRPSSASSCS